MADSGGDCNCLNGGIHSLAGDAVVGAAAADGYLQVAGGVLGAGPGPEPEPGFVARGPRQRVGSFYNGFDEPDSDI